MKNVRNESEKNNNANVMKMTSANENNGISHVMNGCRPGLSATLRYNNNLNEIDGRPLVMSNGRAHPGTGRSLEHPGS